MVFKYISEGITLEFDLAKCIGCSLCTVVCPRRVFKMYNEKAKIMEFDRCIECGACMTNCPVDAIQVKPGAGCAIAILGGGSCC